MCNALHSKSPRLLVVEENRQKQPRPSLAKITDFSITENPIYLVCPRIRWGLDLWLNQDGYSKLGEILEAARGEVTQEELAARLRKPQSFISSYERGQRRIDLLEYLQIAAALKFDPVKLFAEIARKMPAKPMRKK